MALAPIVSAEWVEISRPVLRVTFADGRVAVIDGEQKPFYYGYDAVVLGDEDGIAFTGLFRDCCWVMPPSQRYGGEAHLFPETTVNRDVVRLAKAFWHASREGTFRPQRIDLNNPPPSPKVVIGAWFDQL
jgi:hypothetical protein